MSDYYEKRQTADIESLQRLGGFLFFVGLVLLATVVAQLGLYLG